MLSIRVYLFVALVELLPWEEKISKKNVLLVFWAFNDCDHEFWKINDFHEYAAGNTNSDSYG